MTTSHRKALERCEQLFEQALPKFNWGASFLDANAIALLNQVPLEVKQALADQTDRQPFGSVTVRRLSQRFKNHVDQYQFSPWGHPPYLDNADECHVVYTSPQLTELEAEVDRVQTELNCAEEILDYYAADLNLEQTSFDCIGDYIKAVCEQLKNNRQ